MLDLKPQFLKTGEGDKLVVITETEYNALLDLAGEAEEDAADAEIFRQRMAELAEDPTQILPAEVSALILRGNRLLKALRKWRRLTQIELAGKAGLTQGYLSDLESGRRTGTEATLSALARALDVDVSLLR